MARKVRARTEWKRATSPDRIDAAINRAISSAEIIATGVANLVKNTLVTTLSGVRDVRGEVGDAAVSAVRSSIRAVEEIGGDLGNVAKSLRRRRSSDRNPSSEATSRWPGAERPGICAASWWEHRRSQPRANSRSSAEAGRSVVMMKRTLTTLIGCQCSRLRAVRARSRGPRAASTARAPRWRGSAHQTHERYAASRPAQAGWTKVHYPAESGCH